MGDLSLHFSTNEFECPCCKKVEVNTKLIDRLETIRGIIGNLPIEITSGYRCAKYNTSIDGDSNSAHLTGEGADIKTSLSSIDLALKAEVIKDIRLGLYPAHLHIDIKKANPSRFWFCHKYGDPLIYSKGENDLKKFLKKVINNA
jgi:uncharacterized protein YcbK (DUF882 family)